MSATPKTALSWFARLAIVSLCTLGLSSCSKHIRMEQGAPVAAQHFDATHVQRNLVYSPVGWPQVLSGDLYLPNSEKPAEAWPVVLVVHGGGWARRTREDLASVAQALAKRGYAAFNISHRFAPEYRFPAQVHDLQQAMRWLQAESSRFHLDTNRMGGWGYSSGAHLVAMLGTMQATSPLDSPYGSETIRLKAMVLGGIPSDLSKFSGGPLLVDFLNTTKEENPELYALASPYNHISRQTAASFIYHGNWDMLVPVDHGRDFYNRLQEVGVTSELYVGRFWGHATQFVFDGGAVKKGIAFFDQQLSAH